MRIALYLSTSLIILANIISGCAPATTAYHVAIDGITKDSVAFLIVFNENDPINLAPVILEEISKRGFQANILNSDPKILNQEPEPTTVFGSGFFISKNGMMISNAHVVQNSASIVVRTVNDEKFAAKVLLKDEKNDIAILQPINSKVAEKWLPLAHSKNSKIGEKLFIIGYPLSNLLGKHPRVTEGIISADTGLLDDPTRFQVSASIQPGNSGGPILNESFQVIGITTEKLSDAYAIKTTGSVPQNVNFGLKIDYAKILFNDGIEKSINNSIPQIKSLEDAIDATVLISVSENNTPGTNSSIKFKKYISITFNYEYSWDLLLQNYRLSKFNMQWIDKNTNKVLATAAFTAGAFQPDQKTVVNNVLNEIFIKAGI